MKLDFSALKSLLSGVSKQSDRFSVNNINDRLGRWLAQKTFTTTDRLTLYEDLAFLLDNNLPVEKALNAMILSYGTKRPPVVFCLEDALSAISQGKSVDQGFSEWVPRQEAAILSAGAQDGNLAAALNRAITVVQGMDEMKSALMSTLAYPMLLLGTTFAMMKMVTVYFLPRLETLSSKENWGGALWWLNSISEFFVNNALLHGVFILFIIGFVTWSMPNLTGNVRKHILDKIMPWSIYRDVLGVGFLLNFSALMRAQVTTQDAINILSNHAQPWLFERLAATQQQVSQGDHLGIALRNAGFGFPSPRAIDKLALLTGGDNAENIIENFARNWLKQTVAKIKKTAKLLSNIALGTSAGYMILILLATQDLNNLVGNH
ncbi:type IV pilus biosynthesis protein PilR [Xenorhabdus mauleonii]|uniref:Type II secretory pathway, component PulF n=1 Tax=Xenorhabdus mauleonii TaxID=351675 RepID=A0A1I3V680_9GAMM|nr:type II secretion system F family protein [Xenorhabdus mauleonii]PHM37615.1 type IV pilus biosynthesis protein PilR [Xenorhabdus mauleonii]SFJ89856.1 Type II secretory pathway, component PulF [Xenorhabdus mauleonii]